MKDFQQLYFQAVQTLQKVLPASFAKTSVKPPAVTWPCKNENRLAGVIDHTLLSPDATEDAIEKLCREAREFNFKSVCVAPCRVKAATRFLTDSQVLVCTVIGFPHGNSTTETKVFAAREAVQNGAEEIDMVINIGVLKEGDYAFCLEEIAAVKKAVGSNVLKVILETTLLQDEEKVLGSLLTVQAGGDFVKTSTGFADGGATIADVKLLRQTVGERIGVKASGGIRDLDTAVDMLEAGANRLGCSAGVRIVTEVASIKVK